jgi:pimeloyl-ACP methyl ester carboxylesterase
MLTNRSLSRLIVIYLMLLVISFSCKKDDQEHDYSYFVSKKLEYSYDKEYIKSMIGPISGSIPEITGLTSRVISDISIYSIVYKTTVDGRKINASGLVCVPLVKGDYPVISFQNGTNTVNANAPSVAPVNYQLIGLVASMGYVVVVADYPGFGESADLPHPYLVKEPMVQSMVDLLYTVNELPGVELPGLTIKNEYYLMGYSLGGWATLAFHKELELNYSEDFDLKGSLCGAGPYNIMLLLQNIVEMPEYHMPVYIAYILNAYKSYDQFTNPVSDIMNEPYASRVSTLFNGILGMNQINAQLTTSISELLKSEFLTGFETSAQYSSVRQALKDNSISGWKTQVPLRLVHGSGDTQVNPISTEDIYSQMIAAGTSSDIIEKVIVPGDHGDAAVPAIVQGIFFIQELSGQK